MSLTFQYRPRDFDEVVGQDFAKSVLQGIIKDPSKAPRSLILHGEYGTGKSSLARIFARRINGLPKDFKILDSPYYYEFDSAVVGNVDVVRELRESFSHAYARGTKVIVYDEAHTISSAAQSALLKPLEEANTNVFYMFVTTDIEKLLKTIRSRSVEIKFDLVPKIEVIRNLKEICVKEGREVPEEILDVIAIRSMGHVRDSLMLMDKLFLVGNDEFLKNVYSLAEALEALFRKVMLQGVQNVKEDLLFIVKNPLVYVKQDLENFILKGVFIQSHSNSVFHELKFPQVMSLFSYYVQNKATAFNTTSDAFSFLFIVLKMVGGFVGK